MFNYIKKYFATKPDQKISEPSNLDSNENIITISCDSSGVSKVKIIVNNNSIESAKQFGEMLFLLNEGFYTQSFLDILNEIVESDKNYTIFVSSIIDKWSNKVTEIENIENSLSNKPIVPPTFFYKSAK